MIIHCIWASDLDTQLHRIPMTHSLCAWYHYVQRTDGTNKFIYEQSYIYVTMPPHIFQRHTDLSNGTHLVKIVKFWKINLKY